MKHRKVQIPKQFCCHLNIEKLKNASALSSILHRGYVKLFFEKMIEMANRFKMQFVCDHQHRHIRCAEQFLCVLQFYVVDILRNRAIRVFFEKARELRIAVRQCALQGFHFFVRKLWIIQAANEVCQLIRG